jgi:hypothetical protein
MTTDQLKTVRRMLADMDTKCAKLLSQEKDAIGSIRGSALSGAVRRASMELTRALADLRKC